MTLSRITFPYMPLICLTALVSGVLNGLDRFAAAAAAPMLYNLAIDRASCSGWPAWCRRRGMRWRWASRSRACCSSGCWCGRRGGRAWCCTLPRPRLTPQVRQLLRRMTPGLLGAGVTQLNLSVDVIIGSLLPPGTVSILYYADRVNQLPLGTIGAAVGTALLPTLSRQVRRRRRRARRSTTLNRAIEYALLLTLPAALALIVSSVPIIAVLFGRGAFEPAVRAEIGAGAGRLRRRAAGLRAGEGAGAGVLRPRRHRRCRSRSAWRRWRSIWCSTSPSWCRCSISARRWPPRSPPGSMSARWRRSCTGAGIWPADAVLRRRIPRMLAASAVMVVVLWAMQHTVYAALDTGGGHGLRWVGLALLVGGGMAAYGAAGQAFGAFSLGEVRAASGTAPPPGAGAGLTEGGADRKTPPSVTAPGVPCIASSPASSPPASRTLGNYLGAMRNWVALQDGHECIYCVVDLHAITHVAGPEAARARRRGRWRRALLACGIDAKQHILFNQSAVHAHVRLAWIFNCVARMGWLNRMTQFKDKAGKDRENVSTGLFVYPNLMAADILAYHATRVPVGDDQRQHLELANDIAQKFNHDYGADFFPAIEPVIMGAAARVMSLRDGTKKMSQVRPVGPEPHQPDRRCRHDRAEDPPRQDRPRAAAERAGGAGGPAGGAQPGRHLRRPGRTPISAGVLREHGGKGFGAFKEALAELLIAHLSPIAAETRRWLDDPGAIDAVLRDGAARAAAIADPIVDEAERLVGLLKP